MGGGGGWGGGDNVRQQTNTPLKSCIPLNQFVWNLSDDISDKFEQVSEWLKTFTTK